MRTTLIPDISELKKRPVIYRKEVVRYVIISHGVKEGRKLARKIMNFYERWFK